MSFIKPESSVISISCSKKIEVETKSVVDDQLLFDDDDQVDQVDQGTFDEDEDDEEVLNYSANTSFESVGKKGVKILSEHDYYEEYDTEQPPVIGASELVGENVSVPNDELQFALQKLEQNKVPQRARRRGISDGASRIINLAFERAVQKAIEHGAATSASYGGRRQRACDDPMSVTKDELKERLEQTARDLRPLMVTDMMSHDSSHGLTHTHALWSQLKIDKKFLANLFWEARQQATTAQPGPAYARYTLVAFYAASENLTYPQAAFRCSISYTTAIEYIALCEVRHYFGDQVAREIHEFTMQQIDVEDPNCMRAWSNNCAKFLNDHKRQREMKKNADMARTHDRRLYIHLKGDKRPFRIQKLQNFFLKQNSATIPVSPVVPTDGSVQPRHAPKRVDQDSEIAPEEQTTNKRKKRTVRKKLSKRALMSPSTSNSEPTTERISCAVSSLNDLEKIPWPDIEPPVSWTPSCDPFFLKSVVSMMQTPEDFLKASEFLTNLHLRIVGDRSSDERFFDILTNSLKLSNTNNIAI